MKPTAEPIVDPVRLDHVSIDLPYTYTTDYAKIKENFEKYRLEALGVPIAQRAVPGAIHRRISPARMMFP
ncbi:MAG: hypothetical protein ACE5KF_09730 [Kiloniellaceae bacterium]